MRTPVAGDMMVNEGGDELRVTEVLACVGEDEQEYLVKGEDGEKYRIYDEDGDKTFICELSE